MRVTQIEALNQTVTVNKFLPIAKLQVGDYVRLFEEINGLGVVTQVTETDVTIFRPYLTTANFTYTGGVIPYVGFEECTRLRNEKGAIFVYCSSILR